jgi:hypothetical protein
MAHSGETVRLDNPLGLAFDTPKSERNLRGSTIFGEPFAGKPLRLALPTRRGDKTMNFPLVWGIVTDVTDDDAISANHCVCRYSDHRGTFDIEIDIPPKIGRASEGSETDGWFRRSLQTQN